MNLITDINVLMGTLKDLLESYQQLGEVVGAEAAAILANDLTALDACQKEKETLLARIRSGERARQEAMIPVAAFLGETPGNLTVTGLANRLEGGVAQQLSGLALRLRRLIRSISDTQRTNHILIKHRLDMIRDTLSLLGRIHPSKGGYQSSGMMPMAPSRGRIVSGSV